MPYTISQFRAEQRSLLSDPAGAGQQWSDTDLDVYRQKAFRDLYKNQIANEVTNFDGTTASMSLATSTQVEWAIPAGWSRITDITYWTDEPTPRYVDRSGLWDDRSGRSGYVIIYDAPSFYNYRIRLFGLKNWTGVDDSTMPDEVYDAVLIGSIYYAVKALTNKRAALRRQATNVDAPLGAEAMWLRQVKQDYKEALAKARKSMRMIGR